MQEIKGWDEKLKRMEVIVKLKMNKKQKWKNNLKNQSIKKSA